MTYKRFIARAVALGLPFTACGSYEDSATTSTTASALTSGTTNSATMTTGSADPTVSSSTVGTAGPTTDGSTTDGSTTGDATTTGGGTTTGAGGATTGGAATSTTGAIEASCENVTACGGDVTGTWAVAGSCLPVSGDTDITGFGLNCPGGPMEGAFEVSGTITFGADGKVTDNTITTGEGVVAMPPACKELSGTTVECERLEGPFVNIGFATSECVDDAETGGCSCTVTAEQAGGMAFLSIDAWESAPYTTADTTLTVSVFGDPWEYAYCVEDTTLTISTQSVSRVGTIAGTVALLKQ